MDGGTGAKQPAEQIRNQEWLQRDLADVEAEAEAKRQVGANCEEVKKIEDK